MSKEYIIRFHHTAYEDYKVIVSTSCNDIETRKKLFQNLNGENNYALAA